MNFLKKKDDPTEIDEISQITDQIKGIGDELRKTAEQLEFQVSRLKELNEAKNHG